MSGATSVHTLSWAPPDVGGPLRTFVAGARAGLGRHDVDPEELERLFAGGSGSRAPLAGTNRLVLPTLGKDAGHHVSAGGVDPGVKPAVAELAVVGTGRAVYVGPTTPRAHSSSEHPTFHGRRAARLCAYLILSQRRRDRPARSEAASWGSPSCSRSRRPPLKRSSSNLRRASLPFFPLPVCVPGAQVAGVIRGEENLTIENGADSTPRESSGRALATASNPLRAASSSVRHGNRPSSGRGRRRPPNGEREEGHRFRSRETACGPPVFTACHGGAQETRPHVGDESVGQTSEAYRGIRGRASSGSHVSAHKAVDASHRSSRTPPPVVGARSP